MSVVNRSSVESQLTLTSEATLTLDPKESRPEWIRWCYASINKHFDTLRKGYSLYIEGDIRTELDDSEFAELRIDGPFVANPQKYLYYFDVEINVLCQTHLDPRKHYKAQVMVGVFFKAFKNIIDVKRFGDGPLDDESLLGCFHLQGGDERIEIGYFGIIRPDTKITQTTIEGHYRLELWTKGDN